MFFSLHSLTMHIMSDGCQADHGQQLLQLGLCRSKALPIIVRLSFVCPVTYKRLFVRDQGH